MEIYYWFWLATAVILAMIAIAQTIEAQLDDKRRDFASLKFTNIWVQRICRICRALICPLLYVIGAFFFCAENELNTENTIAMIFLAIVLFISLYVEEFILRTLVFLVIFICDTMREIFSTISCKGFLRWLW